MPKQTFYNLPAPKQEKLRRAIWHEVARVPLHDISISRIIREAEIPRGSFYQYFKDKADMYDLVIQEGQAFIFRRMGEHLRETGDLFEASIRLLRDVLEIGGQDEHLASIRNIFTHMRVYCGGKIREDEGMRDALLDFVAQRVGLPAGTPTREEMLRGVEMVMSQFVWAVAECFIDARESEDVVARYADKMRILKQGLLAETTAG